MLVNITDTIVETSMGEKKSLGDYTGKVLLIVNVASRCGNTPQYSGLQNLQDKYKAQGFAVLGFPCNDFGEQVPGSLNEIKEFCSLKYGANFELFNKVHAKGSTTEPYTTLNKTEPVGDVSWNVPTAGLRTATWVPGTAAHSWQAVAIGRTSIGLKGAEVAAKVLAKTAEDIFLNQNIITEAKNEHNQRIGSDFNYIPLLGDRKPPLDYRKVN